VILEVDVVGGGGRGGFDSTKSANMGSLQTFLDPKYI
jgi:hypothetical protein